MPKRSGFNSRENTVAESLGARARAGIDCGAECRTRRASALALFALALTAPACSAPPTGDEPVATTRAAGSTAFPNDKTAYDYFRAQGFTNFQAAGIVGNLDQESGVDPTISQQGGGPGRGIAQWSAGGRWDTDQGDNLVAFAAMEGLPTSSLQVQLDFIMFELDTFPDYGLAKLQATTNVTDAATEFMDDFEECDVASECDVDSRISYAQDVLTAYGNDPVEVDAGTDAGASAGVDAGAGEDGGATVSSKDAGSSGTGTPPPSGGDDAGAVATASDAGSASASEDAGGSGATGASTPASSGGSGCAVATEPAAGIGRTAWLLALGAIVGAFGRRRAKRRAHGARSSGK